VVTNTGEYITSGETRPLVTDNALSYYVVKRFKQSGRDSLWLDTYQTEVASTGKNNEEIGMLILNVKLISEIKLPDEGQLCNESI